MAPLPHGEVAFLFSDIEGSTQLVQRLGADYVALLEWHRSVIRGAVEAAGGRLFGTGGDACYCAFADVEAALGAAAEAQAQLLPRLRVRMGLHLGRPLRLGDDYAGIDVHRVARVCDAAHGGQVLVSEAAAAAAPHAALRELGSYRLKDLAEPQRLFQLGGADAPAPRAVGAAPLPPVPTATIGRADEIAAVVGLLRDGARLVTLVGPGGAGKTRLALEVARAEAERVPTAFAALDSLRDPAEVLPAVARALGLPGQDAAAELRGALSRQPLVLVLDNVEHVVEAAADVAGVLADLPTLQIVATSREPLGVASERRFLVPPLALEDAVVLLRDRLDAHGSQLRDAADDVLADVCAPLDGLPLAIELAAGRADAAPIDALAGVSVLVRTARDAPARQRSLRSSVAWSVALLTPHERDAFLRLGVFSGSFAADSAAAVAGADLAVLASLTEKSLLRLDPESGRFDLLTTIRAFAREELAAVGAERETQAAHARHVAALAVELGGELYGPRQQRALERLAADHAELQPALEWAERHDPRLGVELATAIWLYWELRGRRDLVRPWLERVLPHVEDVPAAWVVLGRLRLDAGDTAGAGAAFERGVGLARRHGDGRAEGWALSQLSWAAITRGDYGAAERDARAALALARSLDDRWLELGALNMLGGALLEHGDGAEAQRVFEAAVAAARRSGDRRSTMILVSSAANCAVDVGDLERAGPLLAQALALAREVDDATSVFYVLRTMGSAELAAGRPRDAARILREALQLARELGAEYKHYQLLETLAELARSLVETDPARAARVLAAAETELRAVGAAWPERTDALLAVARERLRARLGDDYGHAVATGSAATPAEAVDDALAEPATPAS